MVRKRKRKPSRITSYITNPKHSQLISYDKWYENGSYENIATRLYKDFSIATLEITPEDLIIEIAGFLGGILAYLPEDMDDPDYTEVAAYIDESIAYCENILHRFHKGLEQARQEVSLLSYKQLKGSEPAYLTKQDRIEAGYTPEMIKAVLEHQRVQHNYYQYTDGYYYLRYKLYAWLLKELRVVKIELAEMVNN